MDTQNTHFDDAIPYQQPTARQRLVIFAKSLLLRLHARLRPKPLRLTTLHLLRTTPRQRPQMPPPANDRG